MDDDKGTSLVVIHSEKGKQVFDKLKDKIILNEVNLNEAIKYNEKRNEFFLDLNSGENLTNLIRKRIVLVKIFTCKKSSTRVHF